MRDATAGDPILISGNLAGQPLDNYETLLKHIRTTKSATGFRCHARLDKKDYATGRENGEFLD